MTRQLRERRGKAVRAMQREVDGNGQVQAARPLAKPQDSNAPPSIAPGRVKAPPKTRDDDQPLWFAIWSVNRNLACALKTNPEEIKLCERSLQSAKRAWGDEFSGPFTRSRKPSASPLTSSQHRSTRDARREPSTAIISPTEPSARLSIPPN
jgi:hypothetical protein